MSPASRRTRSLEAAIVVLLSLPLLYFSGYVWARVTHRLVWYGSFVAGPNVRNGHGWSPWEVVFVPFCWAEAQVRGVLPHWH